MNNLLVNTPSGLQEIVTVGKGGGYFDQSRVVWDESTDGPLPYITLGGMVRSGNDLVFDQARKDEHDAAIGPILAQKQAEVSKITGVEILGVMCSATGKDQAGLAAVAVGAMRAQMAGGTFAPTKFKFENGTELVITPENFAEIEAIWTPFRQSFFAP